VLRKKDAANPFGRALTDGAIDIYMAKLAKLQYELRICIAPGKFNENFGDDN
jgi:hypothetical protein